jgi:glycosyltransferase involved in cell wall biosynthesis
MPLSKLTLRSADAVVVTNEHLRQRVIDWGARGVVIGDVPVKFGPGRAPDPCAGPRVVVVNTFSVDEPVDAVLEAARQLADTQFFVTGDVRAARPSWLREKPANLAFTGFLTEDDYTGLLRAADVVLVLTTHDHTMQRGGYEAVALGKPLVTSDWGLLRETFSRGTIHVRNEPAAIADGLRRAIADRVKLGAEMQSLGHERRALFATRLANLVEIIDRAPPFGRSLGATA